MSSSMSPRFSNSFFCGLGAGLSTFLQRSPQHDQELAHRKAAVAVMPALIAGGQDKLAMVCRGCWAADLVFRFLMLFCGGERSGQLPVLLSLFTFLWGGGGGTVLQCRRSGVQCGGRWEHADLESRSMSSSPSRAKGLAIV